MKSTWQLLISLYLSFFSGYVIAAVMLPFSTAEIEKYLPRIENKKAITSVAFSPDGRFLAYAAEDNQVHLWDAQVGKLIKMFEGHTQIVTSMAFCPNNQILVSGSEDKTVRLWDIETKKLLKTLEGHQNQVNSVAFHPRGKMLASSSNGGTVHFWNIYSGELMRKPFQWRTRSIKTISFSPNGNLLAAAGSDLKVRVWDTNSFDLKRFKQIHYLQIDMLAFSPDSNRLASSSKDGTVCIWDSLSGNLIKRLYYENRGSKAVVNTVAFHPDGRLALSFNNSIYWWDGDSDQLKLLLTIPAPEIVHFFAFKPHHPNILAYGASDGIVRLWDIQQQKRVGLLTGNAKGMWFSCLDQQCWCPESLCPPPAKEESSEPELLPTTVLDETLSKEESTEPLPKTTTALDKPLPKLEPQTEPTPSPTPETIVIKDTAQTEPQPLETTTSSNMGSMILIIILIFIVIIEIAGLFYRRFIFRKYVHLQTWPVTQLPKVHQRLKTTFNLKPVLAANHLSGGAFEAAINFVQVMSPLAQAEYLITRLGAEREQTEPNLLTVMLSDCFPLNLAAFRLYVIPPESTIDSIVLQLTQWTETSFQKIVVITLDSEQQQALSKQSDTLTDALVVPNAVELTQWLLATEPVFAFTRMFASQVKVGQISPYQTQSGVNKDAVFFGRAEILAHILNREPANYLVFGGRQLGKSSLLKHIHRYYRGNSHIQCTYLTLHSNNLSGQLAVTLGLPSESSLEQVLTQLRTSKSRQLILVDQADQFIQTEMKTNYRILTHFRSLSEEGHCHFILAGFWDLYQASVLEANSPLKNFGEPITIAELETDACRQLATQPMSIMNLRYTSQSIVEKLIKETGHRANLIATVCHEILLGLTNPEQRVIGEEELNRALNSEAVRRALEGWQTISSSDDPFNDEQANRLDRIVIYTTIKAGQFKIIKLNKQLQSFGCNYTTEQVKHSLERLRLSFVLKREAEGRYVYCVPLFQKWLLEENVDDLLQWELKEE
jgi:WD40 repeat protein